MAGIRLNGWVGSHDGKSQAEISAVNTLRKFYDSLLQPTSITTEEQQSSVSPSYRRRPQSAQTINTRYKASTIRQPRPSSSNALEKWMTLTVTATKLHAALDDLTREVQASESKIKSIDTHHRTRLKYDANEFLVDPKLRCLAEILGDKQFASYLVDLYTEIAKFRLQLRLHGQRFHRFLRKLLDIEAETINKEQFITMFNEINMSLASIDDENGHSEPILLSHFPLLIQHCLDPHCPDEIGILDFAQTISMLPAPRERLLRNLFEQIADVKHGEGFRPPPDAVRSYKLMALAKESLAGYQCSNEEFQQIRRWLDEQPGVDSVDVPSGERMTTLSDFLHFHRQKSDEYILEDAELITYLMRMWQFKPMFINATDAEDGATEDLNELMTHYHVRCQQLTLITRKNELITKIHKALANIDSRTAEYQAKLQQVHVLKIDNPHIYQWIQSETTVANQLIFSLQLLHRLNLSSQSLNEFPGFVAALPQLEELDLSDNRLHTLPSELSMLEKLQKLMLSANFLSEKSFKGTVKSWNRLAALKEVDLSHNRFVIFPTELTALYNLQILNLANNQLRSISASLLKQWENDNKCKLEILDLCQNHLSSLPEEFGMVMKASLRCLRLHYNKLERLPASIAEMEYLEELTLSNNLLASEFVVYPLTKAIQHVRLNHNKLRILPAFSERNVNGSLCALSIFTVDASFNRIRSVPELPLLSQCRELHLQHNAIQELPTTFFTSFSHLVVCKLHNNRLKQLPLSILSCTLLEKLELQENQLENVPVELVKLENLKVLNFTGNNLTVIPSEWHAFAAYSSHDSPNKRTLQELGLKQNPIRNRVFRAIIESGCVEAMQSAINAVKPPEEQICENVIKKLIDGLRETKEVLAMEMVRIGGDTDSDLDAEDNGRRCRRLGAKWKGTTRNVNKYLTQRLLAIQTKDMSNKSNSDRLAFHVDAKQFERMIKSFPMSCSKAERAALIKRFRVKKVEKNGELNCSTRLTPTIDGQAFLHAINHFGHHRTLSPALATSHSVTKCTDPVAPLLQYLLVIYQQRQQQLTAPQLARNKQSEKMEEVVAVQLKNEIHSHAKQSSITQKQKPPSAGPRRVHQAKQWADKVDARAVIAKEEFIKRHRDPERDQELLRQRQRIAILEQQLLDQKLLLAVRDQQELQRRRDRVESTHFSDEDDGNDDDAQRGEQNEDGQAGDCIMVWIKCLQSQIVGLSNPKLKRCMDTPMPIQISRKSTVLELKQQIEKRMDVAVYKQVLVAPTQAKGVSVRLRDQCFVQEYVERAANNDNYNKRIVTLLIGESLQLK